MVTSSRPPRETDRPAGSRVNTFAALKEPGFIWLWLGLVASFFSFSMQNLARGYLAYELTGSATTFGLVLATWAVPMISLGLVAGVIADRVPKKYVLMSTQSVLGISALATAILLQLHLIEVWHLIALGLIQGGAFAFNVPTRQAIIPDLVSPSVVPNAIALISAGSNLSNIAGPPLAGLLIAIPAFGLTGAFFVGAAIYLIVLVMLWRLPIGAPKSASRRSFRSDLGAGIGYVRRHAVLPTLLLMQTIPWVLAMPYQQSMPVFAARALQVGPERLGILMGAIGFGALGGSLVVASLPFGLPKGWIQIVVGVVFCVALVLFAVSDVYWVSVVILFLVGASQNAYASLNQAQIMEQTDRAYYGRVLSVSGLVSALGPLSVLPYGLMIDLIGPRWTFGGGAAIVGLFLIGVALLRPPSRRDITSR